MVYTVWDGMSVSALDAANIVIQVQPFNSPGSLTGDRRVFVVPVGAGTLGFSRENQAPKTKQEATSSEMFWIRF